MPRVQFVKLSVVVIITLVVALIGYGNIAGQAPTATPAGTATAPPTTVATGSPSPAATASATALPATAPAAQPTAAPPTVTAVRPPATVLAPALSSAQCTPAEVTVFAKSPRIEVKCTSATSGISRFDLSTSDPDLVQRALTVLMTAVTDKKSLRITYDNNDASGQGLGCARADCRMISEITLIS